MTGAAERPLDLIGLGECMVEFLASGPLGEAASLRRSFGGDVLNTLVAASRLGGRCGFISRVGDDPFGPAMRQAWAGLGLDVSQAPLVAGDNGVYFISVNDSGEREFSYRRQGSAASALAPADLDEAYIASSHMLLLSGITQALSPTMRAATQTAAEIARRHGVLVAFDPNYRPRLWASQGGLPAARGALHALLPWVDWLLPSHPADSVLLADPALAQAADDPASAAPVLDAFAALAPRVALKLGGHGCLIRADGSRWQLDGAKAASVIDTTGAGDLWAGSFLMGLRQGHAPDRAARVANTLAARKLAYRGAIPPAQLYAGMPRGR